MSSAFLVVIDDEVHRSEVLDALGRLSILATSVSWDSLSTDMALQNARALVCDLGAPYDAARIAQLRACREHHPHVALLCLFDVCTGEALDALHLLGAEVCGKPLARLNLACFVDNLRTSLPGDPEALKERVRNTSSSRHLSRRESELLLLATRGMPRREIAEMLKVSENTVKAQIRSLLKKTGARSLAVLGQHVLRGDAAPSQEPSE